MSCPLSALSRRLADANNIGSKQIQRKMNENEYLNNASSIIDFSSKPPGKTLIRIPYMEDFQVIVYCVDALAGD